MFITPRFVVNIGEGFLLPVWKRNEPILIPHFSVTLGGLLHDPSNEIGRESNL